MGRIEQLRDRAVTALAKELAKAILPTTSAPVEVFAPQGSSFGPGMPLIPYGIDPRNPSTGVVEPRVSEFPISQNLRLDSLKLVPFRVLRDVADQVDIVRRCIEVRKNHMVSLDWDITLADDAVESAMADSGEKSPGKASQDLLNQHRKDIARLRRWWEKPDPFNGLDFASWLGMVLEEVFVIDALTVNPRKLRSGDLGAFEILDGSTIKPLLDYRGSTPLAPAPAYQQILHGFPRGEFTASDQLNETFTAEELLYKPRARRSWTPYGQSLVEVAIGAADVYLKRMAWIRGEFTDGATPDTWMESDIKIGPNGMSPDMLNAYEQVLNDQLAGQTQARREIKLLAGGMKPTAMANFAEKYQSELDEFLIKLTCTCFDVMPTEIGFPPKSGIGGKGHQDGEAATTYRKAIRPTVKWLQSMFTEMSRRYLGMPEELAFKFIGYEVEDRYVAEQTADLNMRGGRGTLNESRADRGLPLYDFPEADTPFIVTGVGVQFLPGLSAVEAAAKNTVDASAAVDAATGETEASEAGEITATEEVADDAKPAPPSAEPAPSTEPHPDTPPPEGKIRVPAHYRSTTKKSIEDEGKAFLTFARKRAGGTWRDFDFEALAPFSHRLNKLGAAGDLDGIKSVLVDVGKARAPKGLPVDLAKAKGHGPKIAKAMAKVLPTGKQLAEGWDATADKSADKTRLAAAKKLVTKLTGDTAPIDDAYSDLMDDGYDDGFDAGSDLVDDDVEAPEDDDRRKALLATAAAVAGAVLVTRQNAIASVMEANTADNLEDAIGAMDDRWAELSAVAEFHASANQGALTAYTQADVANVRLVAGDGECDFCQDYSGRILNIDDDDSGMPPLHNHCLCTVEPVTPGDDDE